MNSQNDDCTSRLLHEIDIRGNSKQKKPTKTTTARQIIILTTARYVTQCRNCFGSNEQLVANQRMNDTRICQSVAMHIALSYFGLLYFPIAQQNKCWMISPKWSLLICSFVRDMKSQQMWKIANKSRHTHTERTPLSVLIANFVYIPHFSCASSFSMSNNILSLDCALFSTLLCFGLATYFATRPLHFLFVRVHYSPNYIHGARIINELTEH